MEEYLMGRKQKALTAFWTGVHPALHWITGMSLVTMENKPFLAVAPPLES